MFILLWLQKPKEINIYSCSKIKTQALKIVNFGKKYEKKVTVSDNFMSIPFFCTYTVPIVSKNICFIFQGEKYTFSC